MAGKSTIKRLPDALRREIDALLRDDKHTISDITEHLKKLGAEVSRSAVGRYSQEFQRMMSDIRMTREMAQAVSRELTHETDSDATQMIVESMHAILLKARTQLADATEIDARAVSDLAKATKDLQTALRSSVDMHAKLREAVAKEAAKVVDEVAPQEGLSATTVAAIKERILGVGKRP
jgi:DNA-binding transcriptional ArsR family regulator